MGCINVRNIQHTDTPECWCKPEVMMNCQECDEDTNPECWACRGSALVEHDGSPDRRKIIIHKGINVPGEKVWGVFRSDAA